jgi:hypothetical protein
VKAARAWVRLCTLILPLGCVVGAAAQSPSLAQLQQLLAAQPAQSTRFVEVRESRWLATPVESSGVMRQSASMHEKRVEQPRPEVWRFLDDRVQRLDASGQVVAEMLFREGDPAAALAGAMRALLSGRLQALGADFHMDLHGSAAAWTLRLQPRHEPLAAVVDHIELRGEQARLQSLVILERRGDRSTTRFFD